MTTRTRMRRLAEETTRYANRQARQIDHLSTLPARTLAYMYVGAISHASRAIHDVLDGHIDPEDAYE